MATLATFYGRLMTATRWSEAETETAREEAASYFLRPLPNEDVAFYIKRIDNSLVVRQADPQARSTCWRSIVVACSAAVLLIALLLPSAYGLLAGYQIERLRKENVELQSLARSLEIDEAKLLTPERLEELARIQQLVDPAPDKVVYLEPKADGTVAMNGAAMLHSGLEKH
jgi:hypothetical protein